MIGQFNYCLRFTVLRFCMCHGLKETNNLDLLPLDLLTFCLKFLTVIGWFAYCLSFTYLVKFFCVSWPLHWDAFENLFPGVKIAQIRKHHFFPVLNSVRKHMGKIPGVFPAYLTRECGKDYLSCTVHQIRQVRYIFQARIQNKVVWGDPTGADMFCCFCLVIIITSFWIFWRGLSLRIAFYIIKFIEISFDFLANLIPHLQEITKTFLNIHNLL